MISRCDQLLYPFDSPGNDSEEIIRACVMEVEAGLKFPIAPECIIGGGTAEKP